MTTVVIVKSEGGKEISSVSTRGYKNRPLPRVEPAYYPMLGHIDPYGNTVFNRSQIEALREEIESICRFLRVDSETFAFLGEVDVLCVEALKRQHRYLWFYGD